MELKQLEYFVACAKTSSLTKASEILYTSQPHVSMVIRGLEQELGIRLFRRRSKGVELTEEGKEVFRFAEKVLKDTDFLYQIGHDQGKVWLKIASNPSSYMASALADYYKRIQDSDILLQYTECGIEQMIDKMDKERYDLGFVFAPMDRIFAMKIMAERRRLEYVELFRSGLVVHVSNRHPLYGRACVTLEELSSLTFIQEDEDYFTLDELLGDHWKDNSQTRYLNRVISTNSDHLMIQMLDAGTVCNVGSYWLRDKYRLYNFGMVPIAGYEDKISFGYLKHKNHSLTAHANKFMTFLMEEILENAK